MPLRYLPVSERQHPQSFHGKISVLLPNHSFILIGNLPKSFGCLNMFRQLQQSVHGALYDHAVLTINGMEGRHHFTVAVKRKFIRSRVIRPYRRRFNAVSAAQIDQRRLRRVPDFPPVLVGGIIAQNAVIHQTSLCRIVHIYFGCRNSLPLHVVIFHCHFVLRQGSGFVRTYYRYAAQYFHRLELADYRVLLRHFLCPKRKYDCHNRAEGFRDCRNCKRHGKHERASDVLSAKNINGEQNPAEYQNQHGQFLAEVLQVCLKWGLFLRSRLQKSGNSAHLRFHSNIRYHRFSASIGDEASGEQHVGSVAQRHIF